MTELYPNYYHKFSCIADRCKHNCCIGWEIDIDDKTMQLYNSIKGTLGDRIRANIAGEIPHFVLGEGDRCPFLNSQGLCEIICEFGEDALCDICTMHPRFCNFYSSFCEVGLGLCCEEAAKIILTTEEEFEIELPQKTDLTGDEEEFFAKRREIFDILQNRSLTIGARFEHLAKTMGFEFDFCLEELCDFCLGLERMDDEWTKRLKDLREFSFDKSIFANPQLQIPLEQLAVYFVFRHLGDALWDDDYASRIRFALIGCYIVAAMWDMLSADGVIAINDMVDAARMYSAEIEYSRQNTDELMMF